MITPSARIPHPIPYQGSKRGLAREILGLVEGQPIRTLYEPFAGSAALTLAAIRAGLAARYVLADSLVPLVAVWNGILEHPEGLASAYGLVWRGQLPGDDGYFAFVRDRFNDRHEPADLLYLLARCVKNSPRWNREGRFNQSADRRRLGVAPDTMRRAIVGAHHLLRGRTEARTGDFVETIRDAGPEDLVYMDPPYEGTSSTRDSRYHQGLGRERLLAALADLNRRGVPWLLSYDGRCGDKTYGAPLPKEIHAAHIELRAGRSSQATLNGIDAVTVESLYVSRGIGRTAPPEPRQVTLWDAGSA